jgi:hypothetical protein
MHPSLVVHMGSRGMTILKAHHVLELKQTIVIALDTGHPMVRKDLMVPVVNMKLHPKTNQILPLLKIGNE